jgi:flagellar hook capping protein FlgD
MSRLKYMLLLLLIALPARAGVVVITTDFATFGGVTTLADQAPWTADVDAATISSDAIGRYHDGLFYVVNRAAANIQVLDPAAGMSLLREFSVGVGRNPQDIVFDAAGLAYVSCYDEALLLQVDTEGGTVVDSWSTAAYADADGLPETSWMIRRGDRLYITCQRMDRNNYWQPADYGQLLVFALDTQAWLEPIRLTGLNPNTRPVPDSSGDGILIGTAGTYGLQDGGIERVDCLTSTSGAFLFSESDMGGDLLDLELCDTHIWALLSTPTWQTLLVRMPAAGGSVELLETASGYDYSDLAFDGRDQVFLADRVAGRSGVRVFAADTALELTSDPVATGRPPFMIAVDSDVEIAHVPQVSLTLRAPWPNPANPQVNFSFSGRPDQHLTLSVFDLRGRRVFSVETRTDALGQGGYTFDGVGSDGRQLPAGAYRVRLSGGENAGRGFVLVH